MIDALAARLRPSFPGEARAAVANAAPAAFLALVRWLLTAFSGLLVAHHVATHAQALEYVADLAPGVAAYLWSVGQKAVAAYRLRLAIAAPEGLARPPAAPSRSPDLSPAPAKERLTMSSKFDFSALAAAAKAEFEKLEPEVAAALPADFADTVASAVDSVAAEAKATADAEIEAATHQVPPALQPFAPDIEALIDAGIDAAQAEAEKKVAQLQAAKASLAPVPDSGAEADAEDPAQQTQ